MIKIYLTENDVTNEIDSFEKECWINMIHPTEKELNEVTERYNLDPDDLRAALDEEETSRISVEDDYTLVLFDIPTVEERNGKNRYVTIPLGVILHKEAIITICLESTPVLDFFAGKKSANFSTRMKTRFLLLILLSNAKLYLKSLRIVNKQADELEKSLHDSIENSALIDMMELGKSLLYFTTSLKSISMVLEKLLKTDAIKKYPEDDELLEDVMIENKQALETSEIYNNLLNGMMDAYSSIIGNNMNVVQKFIAVANTVLSIPNIITGIWGMNIENMPLTGSASSFWILNVISLVLSLITLWYFEHKKMY